MKAKRHAKIIEIISKHNVDTQEELLRLLKEEGYNVTQATVSRDIKELRLAKTTTPDGKYKYAMASRDKSPDMSFKFYTFFEESVHTVDYVSNFVVVKCYTGMANAVCAAMDTMDLDNVVGTLSGDDTIFILLRHEKDAVELAAKLSKYMMK